MENLSYLSIEELADNIKDVLFEDIGTMVKEIKDICREDGYYLVLKNTVPPWMEECGGDQYDVEVLYRMKKDG